MKENVPEDTPQVVQALQIMGYSTIHRVPTVPREDCVMNQCWQNVPSVIEREGGEIVPGRIVWIEESGRWLHLEAHCCWRMPDGTLIDPTPKMDQEQEIAFVEEPLKWEGYLIVSRYHCFSNEPEVVEYLELIQQWNEIQSKLKVGEIRQLEEFTPSEQDVYRRVSLATLRMMSPMLFDLFGNGCGTVRQHPQRVRRNQACPCGSGRKFKRCCGAPK